MNTKSGDAAFLDDVAGRAHDYCRHAVLLEVSRYQTHGLVADRSKRREEHGIDIVLTAPLQDPGSGSLTVLPWL